MAGQRVLGIQNDTSRSGHCEHDRPSFLAIQHARWPGGLTQWPTSVDDEDKDNKKKITMQVFAKQLFVPIFKHVVFFKENGPTKYRDCLA